MEFEGDLYTVNKEIVAHLNKLANRDKPCRHVKVKISEPRNYQFHKKFMALCKLVADYKNIELDGARQIITVKSGHYDAVVLNKDYTYYYPKSISFAQMDEASFKEFYEKAKLVVCEIWDFEQDELENLIQF